MYHVLEVIGDGTPGGGTTAVLALSRELARRGAAVTIASQQGSYIIREARISGIRVLELDFRRRRSAINLGFALSRYIGNADVTVSHAHGARACLPFALLPEASRGPFAYTVHGFHYAPKPIGVRGLARAAERLCMSRSAITVFVARTDRNQAVAERLLPPGKDSTVIYNAAEEYEATPDSISTKRFDIAVLCRLHFQKNPLIIPEILLALRPARPTVAIIGGGPLEECLRARVASAGLSGQVTFCGECSHQQGLALLSQARIMLQPSLSEGLSISVIEAMHRAIPVVASRVGGLPEQIDHLKTGYLVEASDVKGFARALRELLDDPEAGYRMGSRAKQKARTIFSSAQNLEEHLAMYAGLARRKPICAVTGENR